MAVEGSQKNKVSPVNPVLGYMKSPLPLTNIGNTRSGSWGCYGYWFRYAEDSLIAIEEGIFIIISQKVLSCIRHLSMHGSIL